MFNYQMVYIYFGKTNVKQNMNRIFKKSRNIKERLTSYHLNDDEMSVLLSVDGIKTEKELTEFLKMPENQLSSILKKLENSKLITLVKPKKSELKPPHHPQKQDKTINVIDLQSEKEMTIHENNDQNQINSAEITKSPGEQLTINEVPTKIIDTVPEKEFTAQPNGSISLLYTKDLVKIKRSWKNHHLLHDNRSYQSK
jgi:hypothetical protein